MKILIDNGHGINTPGKRSPDGRFREYAYTRLIASGVVQNLIYRGYDAALLVPEPYDVCQRMRIERVNSWCRLLGKRNVILVSIHVNAAGEGNSWHNTSGWCCYAPKGRVSGEKLSSALFNAASIHLPGHIISKECFIGDTVRDDDYSILANIDCSAALTENGFMDCKESIQFLESEDGKWQLVALHVDGIVAYLRNK